MKDLEFNLQLFAESAENADTNTEQPVQDSVAEGNEPSQDNKDFDWSIDTNTGDVTLNPAMFDDDDSDGTEEPEPEEQPKAEEPQMYTVKVDGVEKQVSINDLLAGYMMQSDYTSKTQKLAEERRQFEDARNQYAQQQAQQRIAQQQAQRQPQQQAKPQVDPKAYYKTLSDYAIKRVTENLGEDFDEYNPIHQAALADEVSTIKAAMYERNVKQQEIQQVYNKYSQDPNIREIDQYAAQRLQQLPYGQAVQIQQALRNNDARVIDAYMGAVRDEYYRAKGYIPASEQQQQMQAPPMATPPQPAQPKPKPPFAESTGTVKQSKPNTQALDYSKLGKLTLDQQAALASKLGLG